MENLDKIENLNQRIEYLRRERELLKNETPGREDIITLAKGNMDALDERIEYLERLQKAFYKDDGFLFPVDHYELIILNSIKMEFDDAADMVNLLDALNRVQSRFIEILKPFI